MRIDVPYFRSRWAAVDPTHRHAFAVDSLGYFDPAHVFFSQYRYSVARFSIERVIFNERFPSTGVRGLLARVANRWPERYEQHLSPIFPLDELTYMLRVIKEEPGSVLGKYPVLRVRIKKHLDLLERILLSVTRAQHLRKLSGGPRPQREEARERQCEDGFAEMDGLIHRGAWEVGENPIDLADHRGERPPFVRYVANLALRNDRGNWVDCLIGGGEPLPDEAKVWPGGHHIENAQVPPVSPRVVKVVSTDVPGVTEEIRRYVADGAGSGHAAVRPCALDDAR